MNTGNDLRFRLLYLTGRLFRTKHPELEPVLDRKRPLTTLDLCSLGVGSCVGTGVYLVAGLVVRDYAGPAAVISFSLAALASLLSGVCYAEFGVRNPHCSGSAYQYSYACVGELVAFVVGWNLLLEYMIGSAAGACAISAAIDAMFGGAISDFGQNSMQLLARNDYSGTPPPPVQPSPHRLSKHQLQLLHQKLLGNQLGASGSSDSSSSSSSSSLSTLDRLEALFDSGTYRPDFMAALICCLMTAILATGVRKSVKFTNCLNALNLILFAFIVLAALPYVDFRFWSSDFYANGRWDALQASTSSASLSIQAPGSPAQVNLKRTVREIQNWTNQEPVSDFITESIERMSTTASPEGNSTLASMQTSTETVIDTSTVTTTSTTIEATTTTTSTSTISTTTEDVSTVSDIQTPPGDDFNEPNVRSTTNAPDPIESSENKRQSNSTSVHRSVSNVSKKPVAPTKIESGFAPFGWQGVLRGAATCFYGFVGFDVIACTGGQSAQPGKCVPLAMVGGTLAALAVYVLSCCLITLLVPTPLVSASSALVHMFDLHQADFAKSVAALGALSSLTVAMFGSMFPLPRVAAAMAADRLLWPRLAERSELTSGPMFGTIVLGIGTSVLALVCPLPLLVEMMSIGTLVAYTMVSMCVLLLRYRPINPDANKNSVCAATNEPCTSIASNQSAMTGNDIGGTNHMVRSGRLNSIEHSNRQWSVDGAGSGRQISRDEDDEDDDDEYGANESLSNNQPVNAYGSVPYQYGGGSGGKRSPLMDFLEKCSACLFPYGWRVLGPPTEETSWYVLKLTSGFVASCVALDFVLAYCELSADRHFLLTLIVVLASAAICTLFTIARQPQNKCELSFRAPGVPYIPGLAIVINIYLIFKLSYLTLIRFAVWLTAGLLIYFFWGIKNSSLEQLSCHVAAGSYLQTNLELKHRPEVTAHTSLNPFVQAPHVAADQYTPSVNYASTDPRNPFSPNFSVDEPMSSPDTR